MTQEEIKKKIIEALDTDTYSEHMGRQRAIEQIEALTDQVRRETVEEFARHCSDEWHTDEMECTDWWDSFLVEIEAYLKSVSSNNKP